MTAARGATIRASAAGVCCLVAALAYSGAVTVFALLSFVLPAVVLVAILTSSVARLSVRAGVVVGLVTALVLSELVNLVSGTANGPAARSSFAAAALTALAVAAVLGRAPVLFTAGVVGVVVGALGLGAGAEVGPVAVATAVVTVVALAVVEAQGRRWNRRAPQLALVMVLALLVGTIVAAIALQADRRLDGEPAVLAPGAVQQTIRPPQLLGDPDPRPTPTETRTPTASSTSPLGTADPTPSSDSVFPLRTIWLVVALVVLVLLLSLPLRILWVALAWRRLRRRLQSGSAVEQVGGAWVWARCRMVAAGLELPMALSVDAVASGRGVGVLPRVVRRRLVALASVVGDAIFAPTDNPDPTQVASAWDEADRLSRDAVGLLGPLARGLLAVRPLSSNHSRPALMSGDLVEMR